MRLIAAFILLLLVASPALAQSTYTDGRRHFSFPVPSGWTEVSKEDLKEIYEQINEGFDGLPITLAAWEKNPSQRTTEPTLVLRWRKMKHTDATAAYERLKTGGQAALDEVLADQKITKAYKIGKVTFDEDSASVRIPHGYESLHTEDVKILTVRYLGQYGLICLEFRGAKGAFDRCREQIDATVAGFEWEERFRVNYEPEPYVPPPDPAPAQDSASSSGPRPFDAPPPKPDFPIAPGMILAIVAVLVGIGVLALVVVKLGGGNRPPPPRRRGGGYRRR